MEIIGRHIAALRKEKGVKQEELAKRVGVSPQAVSKWENGGVPDIELLPAIADYFGVSIDSLFGRTATDYSDVRAALMKQVNSTPEEQRLRQVLNTCFAMEKALMPHLDYAENRDIEDYERAVDADSQHYSSVMLDNGFTRMGIANRAQYFLIVQDAKDTEKAYFAGIDYPSFFEDFADRDFFNACVYFHQCPSGVSQKGFTLSTLAKKLGVTAEKATAVVDNMKKYGLITGTPLELEEETVTVYHFVPTPSFVALLTFAREMIDPPRVFAYFNNSRNTPYLSGGDDTTSY